MARGLRVAGAAGLAAGLAVLAAASPLGPYLEQDLGQLLLYRLRGPVPPPPGVVVVGQDYELARALGLPLKLGGWPRPLLARMIDHASAAGARAIVLDLILDSPQDPAGDAELAAAIARSGNVVLFQRMRREQQPDAPGRPRIVEEETVPPLPSFAQGALAAAPYPLPKVGARLTSFWTFKTGAGGEATLPAAALLAAVLGDPADRLALAQALEAAGLPDAVGTDGQAFETRIARLRSALLKAPEQVRTALIGRHGGRVGAALRLLTGPDTHMLAPYGPAGWLPRLPYHRVVNGDPATLAGLRDQILFVGVSDVAQQVQIDDFRTVFERPDGINFAGVEVAATACLNLLHDEAVQPMGRAPALALAATAAAATATAAVLLTPLLSILAGLALAAGTVAAGVAALSAWHLALPAASLALLAAPLGLLVGLLARYGILRRHLDRAVGLLTRGRHARASVLDGLAAAGRHEQRWAVCLSTDLAGYVTLTDSMHDREPALAALIADYRALLYEVVERRGGTVLGWAGDASMSAWLADRPDAAVRARAVAAALELAQKLEHFAARLGIDAHHTRVGLAEGEIVMGNLAAGDRFSFGAVGEPLNVATRLEQLNKQLGTRVLATRGVVDGLADLRLRAIGPVRLRGRSQPDEIVALEPA